MFHSCYFDSQARRVLTLVDRLAALLEIGSDDGNAGFIADLEGLPGRPVARGAPGRKSKRAGAEQLDLLK